MLCKDFAFIWIDRKVERVIAYQAIKLYGWTGKLVDGVGKRGCSIVASVASEHAVNIIAEHVADA